MKFDVSVLDYLGKYNDGVLVLVSIQYDGVYHDATFFYNKEHMLLTTSESLDDVLPMDITSDEDYPHLIRYLMSKTIPYNEIINRLDEYIPKMHDE